MFSKELEALIEATLEDGKLTDQEKNVLVKRAQREGVDIDELEVYIQSLLQKRERELNEKRNALDEKYEKEKKDAIGRTCPMCGKQVPPLTLKCVCGYEFTKLNCSSAVQILSDKIEKINSRPLPVKGDERDVEIKSRNSQIVDLIFVFPVPNTKEDIIEFLSLAAPNSKFKGGMWGTISGRIKILSIIAVIVFILSLIFGGEERVETAAALMLLIAGYGAMACFQLDQDSIRHNKRAEAWKAKFDQVLMKGRSLRGDSDFQQQLDYFESMVKQ